MKSFSYKCRDSAGAIKSGIIQAENRNAVVKSLSQKGYVPLSIAEEINSKSIVPSLRFAIFWKVLLVLLVIMSATIATIYFSKTTVNPKSTGITKKKNVVSTDKTPKVNKRVPSDKPDQPAAISDTVQMVSTNDSKGSLSSTPAPTTYPSQDIVLTNSTNSVALKMKSEKLMLMLSAAKKGRRLPHSPITPAMAKDFTVAMTNNIVIDEKDSEKNALRKEDVAWMKVDVADMVKQGYKPEDIFKAIENDHNARADAREKLLLHARLLWRDGREQEYTEFIQSANDELQKNGIDPIQANEIDRKLKLNQ